MKRIRVALRHLVLALCLMGLLGTAQASAQCLDLALGIGGTGSDQAIRIAADGSGNVYVSAEASDNGFKIEAEDPVPVPGVSPVGLTLLVLSLITAVCLLRRRAT